MRQLVLLLFGALLAPACHPEACDGVPGTCLAVELRGDIAPLDAVEITVDGAAQAHTTARLPDGHRSLPVAVLLGLPDSGAGDLEVTGLALLGSDRVGRGVTSVSIAAGQHARVVVELRPVTSTCSDGVRGRDETDVDCGGACGPCSAGQACKADSDCMSGTCAPETLRCRTAPTPGFAAPTRWLASGIGGTRWVRVADVNADGLADAIAGNENDVSVALSSGSAFGAPSRWLNARYDAQPTTGWLYFADLNGDGKADGVSLWGDIFALLSLGTRFDSMSPLWRRGGVLGDLYTLVADVNGDGRADLIAGGFSKVQLYLSDGQRFPATSIDYPGSYGARWNLAADVDGDGKSDLLLGREEDVYVLPSKGSSFGTAIRWFPVPLIGSRQTSMADVNGDRMADVVMVDVGGVQVALSTGSDFSPPAPWFKGTFHGTRGTFVADVNGDKKADLVAIGDSDIQVALSNGASAL